MFLDLPVFISVRETGMTYWKWAVIMNANEESVISSQWRLQEHSQDNEFLHLPLICLI